MRQRASVCGLGREAATQQDAEAGSLAPGPAFNHRAPLHFSSCIGILHFFIIKLSLHGFLLSFYKHMESLGT